MSDTAATQARVLYFYDALCGWCYGFKPVIEQLQEQYGDQVEISVLSGGMVTGDQEGPIGEVAGYIKEAYKDVEARTGVKFGKDFKQKILEPGTAIFSSEPTARALTTFKTYRPKEALAFAGTLQHAIYYDGLEPMNWKGYGKYAGQYGLPTGAFVQRMKSDDIGMAAAEEIALSSRLGIRAFPTVLYNKGEDWALLSRGYIPYEELEKNLLEKLDQ